jgi:hypothetical protein
MDNKSYFFEKLCLEDIDNFNKANDWPRESASGIADAIRNLDEKLYIEPSIRDIICDLTETAHGPSERADILTEVIKIHGRPKLAAFVIKGKSYQKVIAKDVTHQLVRLKDIKGLDIAVFVAVGDIQDNARNEFYRVCEEGRFSSLLIDRWELARLLVAYQKICPDDGSFLKDGKCIKCEFIAGKEEQPQREKMPNYTILTLEDVSHAIAKRYSANILIKQDLTKEEIKNIIIKATEDIKKKQYYRNDMTRERWDNLPANIVWLFVYKFLEDYLTTNWICRSSWIDPNLKKDFRPHSFNTGEFIKDIELDWNKNYQFKKDWYREHTAEKDKSLENIDNALSILEPIMEKVRNFSDAYELKTLQHQIYIKEMQALMKNVENLLISSGDWPFSTLECKDLDDEVQKLITLSYNAVMPYSGEGLKLWDENQRVAMVKQNLKDFFKLLPIVLYKRKQLN